ncbi:DNA primase large subunit PriL [Halogeometricum borinquense]|uniref:DNA primase large subunit PriL n=1 Tax=Halogeometricum borinquense TaxID=60847 RepID=A0A6C0UEI5_9EURY|nr:DNA primase large subunit PriL [Halogeometricum borinquense]QIB72953.1 DNA primase large subunit PriL [Halogeometricum borinquense]QIQ75087.1 DNA primase large subunit PriL [Halogeometricum borinquense]
MDPHYARYPFFDGARAAVGEADISPAALIAEDAPAVERGLERVERALMEGTVAAEEPHRWSDREELLSYPIARILVSLVDTPAAVDKYAAAEATTAHDRFRADFETDDDGLQSTATRTVSLEDVLREFDLAADVRPERSTPDSRRRSGRDPIQYWIDVGAYLTLSTADWGEKWRLVNRELATGAVRVTTDELHRLLEEAVHRRVADGLPFEVRGSSAGDEIADALEDEVASIRDLLNDHDAAGRTDVEAVVPALFPPCMKALVQRARGGESLPAHSEFSLVSFLVALGMDATEVTTLLDVTDETASRIATRVEYLTDAGGSQFAPPSCASMQSYSDCVNKDERCETISHPLSYYTSAVRDAGDVRDWRETVTDDE